MVFAQVFNVPWFLYHDAFHGRQNVETVVGNFLDLVRSFSRVYEFFGIVVASIGEDFSEYQITDLQYPNFDVFFVTSRHCLPI